MHSLLSGAFCKMSAVRLIEPFRLHFRVPLSFLEILTSDTSVDYCSTLFSGKFSSYYKEEL